MKNILLIFTALLLTSCTKKYIGDPKTLAAFEAFKAKQKFNQDPQAFYPGAATPEMKIQLIERINLASDDFIEASETGTKEAYQDAMRQGLARFNDIYQNIDTEDRERVAYYFEELMNIAGVKTSEGKLNGFMY